MTHVSRWKLPDGVLQQIIDSFLYVLTDIKDKRVMAEFLDSFLSKTEKTMLAKRLAIAFLLTEQVEETKIAETLHVTQATVSRMKLWLETKGAGYQQAIDKIKKQKTLEELKILALKLVNYSIRAAGGRI
jgi:uncharacterized protein YerC